MISAFSAYQGLKITHSRPCEGIGVVAVYFWLWESNVKDNVIWSLMWADAVPLVPGASLVAIDIIQGWSSSLYPTLPPHGLQPGLNCMLNTWNAISNICRFWQGMWWIKWDMKTAFLFVSLFSKVKHVLCQILFPSRILLLSCARLLLHMIVMISLVSK